MALWYDMDLGPEFRLTIDAFAKERDHLSFRASPMDYVQVAAWLKHGLLTHRTITIDPGITLRVDDHLAGKASWMDGSQRHARLKAVSATWLGEQGAIAIRFEQLIGNRRADVACFDLGMVVECGNSNPRALPEILIEEGWNAFCTIPFADEGEPWTLHEFRATDELHSEWEEWKEASFEMMRSSVAKALGSRR